MRAHSGACRAAASFPGAFVAALWLGLAAPAAAQRLEPRSFPLRRVESFTFNSALMGRRYDISIGFPPGYQADSGRRYPTLVATDGNHLFPIVWGVSDGLMDQGPTRPPDPPGERPAIREAPGRGSMIPERANSRASR
jgi:hypothetical protein